MNIKKGFLKEMAVLRSLSFRLQWLLGLALVFAACASGNAQVLEKHKYLEQKGGDSVVVHWKLEMKDDLRVVVRAGNETYSSIVKPSGEVLEWKMQGPEQALEGRRKDNTIHLNGRREGDRIDREMPIDGAPWYQVPTYSLRSLLDSHEEEINFWVVRPDKLSPVKMKAEKKGTEEMVVDGKPMEALKVRISLAGWKSVLWHGHYWYRKSDGTFLRYVGRNGPPGEPVTYISPLSLNE